MARLLAVLLLVVVSSVSQATARGSNGGPIMSLMPHSGFGFGRPGFFAKRGFVHPDFAGHRGFFHHGFVRNRFVGFQHGFPVWWGGSGWDGWGGAVGDLSDYGYAYPPVQQAQAPDPQVIVIHTDDEGRMTTAEADPDYSYVGCHAIPNGYHCDTTTKAH